MTDEPEPFLPAWITGLQRERMRLHLLRVRRIMRQPDAVLRRTTDEEVRDSARRLNQLP
jgi:hypothetical protein